MAGQLAGRDVPATVADGQALVAGAAGASWAGTTVLTTGLATNVTTQFVQANATIAGTSISGTIASNVISLSVGPYLTTAMASNRGSDFLNITAGLNLTSISATLASNSISLSIGAYLTTAALSNHSHGNPTLALTNLTGTTASASNGFTLSLSGNAAGGGDAIRGIAASGSTATSNTVLFSNLNGVSFGFGAAGNSTVITASHNALTTAAASNHSHGNPTLNLTNLSGTTASASDGFTLSLSAGNYLTTAMASNRGSDFLNITAGLNLTSISATFASNSISLSIGAYLTTAANSTHSHGNPTLNLTNLSGTTASASNGFTLSLSVAGPTTYSNFYEPFELVDGTATTTGTLSQLNLQPFTVPFYLSFGQIQMIGIATVPATSISNSHSGRVTNSTQRYIFSTNYTIGNTNIVDLFFFSRGTGAFSTELETFASTRNSFATNYQATYWGDATLTNTAGGSLRGSQTISVTISYPFMTSAQSINGASTHTTWASGYTTWTSAANNSIAFTYSTSAARTLSVDSTYPATVGWSGAKLVYLNFATSLTPGEYWLGMLRHSSSSGSSSTANSFTGAAGTGNSYSASFNSTALANTQVLTWVGKTVTVLNSLGSLGFVTTANMAPQFGLGSFSGTWASNTTYLNNAANPVGAVAFTQLLTGVSNFQSWFQMNSNRMV